MFRIQAKGGQCPECSKVVVIRYAPLDDDLPIGTHEELSCSDCGPKYRHVPEGQSGDQTPWKWGNGLIEGDDCLFKQLAKEKKPRRPPLPSGRTRRTRRRPSR